MFCVCVCACERLCVCVLWCCEVNTATHLIVGLTTVKLHSFQGATGGKKGNEPSAQSAGRSRWMKPKDVLQCDFLTIRFIVSIGIIGPIILVAPIKTLHGNGAKFV